MIIGYRELNSFELYVMDLLEKYQDSIKDVKDLKWFSQDLHESIETAITDMLEDGYGEINPDDYDPQF